MPDFGALRYFCFLTVWLSFKMPKFTKILSTLRRAGWRFGHSVPRAVQPCAGEGPFEHLLRGGGANIMKNKWGYTSLFCKYFAIMDVSELRSVVGQLYLEGSWLGFLHRPSSSTRCPREQSQLMFGAVLGEELDYLHLKNQMCSFIFRVFRWGSIRQVQSSSEIMR